MPKSRPDPPNNPLVVAEVLEIVIDYETGIAALDPKMSGLQSGLCQPMFAQPSMPSHVCDRECGLLLGYLKPEAAVLRRQPADYLAVELRSMSLQGTIRRIPPAELPDVIMN